MKEVDLIKAHFDKNCTVKGVSPHSAKVHSVGWSCDGKKLASGSFDKSVILHSLERFVDIVLPAFLCSV